MTITFEQTNEILKTLPISYYAKRNIEVTLSENDECSFFEQATDKIIVSYSQLNNAFLEIKEDENVEELIRTMIYHEISHAILTPEDLTFTDQMNIFEDERIETILNSFYMNTNFKKLVKLVNHFDGTGIDTADKFYYAIVRFRFGPKELVDKVDVIIRKYKNLIKASKWFTVSDYEKDVEDFYKECKNYFEQNQHFEQNNISKEKEQNQQSEQEQNQEQSKQNQEQSSAENSQEETVEIETDSDETSSSFTKEEVEEIFANAIAGYNDKAIEADLFAILSQITAQKNRNSSAINSYSGRFDTRSLVRNDYKYFLRENRNGNVKQFTKFHLNLFIDCSGSFYRNDIVVNKILYGLKEIEKLNKNFEFDLIECGTGQRILEKSKRIHSSGGGNHLNNEIYSQFKELQKADAENYNIALFDGDANPDKNGRKNTFDVFNHSNCFIISDEQNKRYIEKTCKDAKVLYSDDYTEELFAGIKQALSRMGR